MDGEKYSTVEHAYQAAKTWVDGERESVRAASTPNEARKLGQKVPMHADWEDIKTMVMHNLVEEKFNTDDELESKLLETGDLELIEGNYWGDKFWGVCFGEGKNNLGKILMSVREDLKSK